MMKHLDHPKRRGQRRPENLREQVDAKTMALFPTPTAQQYGTGQNGKRSDGTTYKQAGKPSLQTMALHNLWPTPRASEYKDCGPVGSKSHTHMRDRSYLCAKAKDPDQPTGKLNPAWVEWLMGFPTGWTELED